MNVEARDSIKRDSTSSRRRAPGIPLEIRSKLDRYITELMSLKPDSITDAHMVADELLEILASDKCNDTVKVSYALILAAWKDSG